MWEGLFQPMHLVIIAGIALLVLGPRMLPELGKGLGDGIRSFKSAMAANGEQESRPAEQGLTAATGTSGSDSRTLQ